VSTGLTVCYSFLLFYFVLCGNFNFVTSYSVVETNYNIMFVITGLLIISIFGGGFLMYVCKYVCFPGVTAHCGCIFHSPVAGFSLLVLEVS